MKYILYKNIVPAIAGRDGFGTSRPKRDTSLFSLLRHDTKIRLIL
nr:MAG TPA: hypothetical protein [Caudoviricetes sp.]